MTNEKQRAGLLNRIHKIRKASEELEHIVTGPAPKREEVQDYIMRIEENAMLLSCWFE